MAEPKRIRVLIADDEPLARQRIADLLRDEPNVDLLGEADSGTTAARKIRELKPDLVFLDVQMPGMTGLEVVREIGVEQMPATIFVTAYDQFAVKAFELNAIDYLVKPFDDERFQQALDRARKTIELEDLATLRERLLGVLGAATPAPATSSSSEEGSASEPWLERIAVEMKGKVRVVPVAQIDYIVSDGPYAELHTAERSYIIRETMQTLETRLDPQVFMRIHRSAIVRVERIETLFRGAGGDYEVLLTTGARLPVSRSRREALEKRLGVTS